MLKKFIISKELKSLARISFPAKANPNDDVSINADSASDEGDVEETAGDSKVLPTTVKGWCTFPVSVLCFTDYHFNKAHIRKKR